MNATIVKICDRLINERQIKLKFIKNTSDQSDFEIYFTPEWFLDLDDDIQHAVVHHLRKCIVHEHVQHPTNTNPDATTTTR